MQPATLPPLTCLYTQVRAEVFPDLPPHKITVRIDNVTPLTPLRLLKANCINKFVSIRGNVIRVSAVRPLVVRMAFECPKCHEQFIHGFPDGIFSPPTKCCTKGCRSRTFERLTDTAHSVDWQRVRIQEVETDHDVRVVFASPPSVPPL